jgi:hypothetical protein
MNAEHGDPLNKLASLVADLDEALRTPGIEDVLGSGLALEFRYSVSAFKARFKSHMPDAQQDLFSATAT